MNCTYINVFSLVERWTDRPGENVWYNKLSAVHVHSQKGGCYQGHNSQKLYELINQILWNILLLLLEKLWSGEITILHISLVMILVKFVNWMDH